MHRKLLWAPLMFAGVCVPSHAYVSAGYTPDDYVAPPRVYVEHRVYAVTPPPPRLYYAPPVRSHHHHYASPPRVHRAPPAYVHPRRPSYGVQRAPRAPGY